MQHGAVKWRQWGAGVPLTVRDRKLSSLLYTAVVVSSATVMPAVGARFAARATSVLVVRGPGCGWPRLRPAASHVDSTPSVPWCVPRAAPVPARQRLSPVCAAQGKGKKPFIDRSTAAHFHLVHRSQRDPRTADPEAAQRVLTAAEISANLRGASDRDTQASRAWAAEQDLVGFEEAGATANAGSSDMQVGGDEDYDYGQHLRVMGGGTFIPREGLRAPSEASAALSHVSRAPRVSRQAELRLRSEAGEAFASTDELAIGVGGVLSADSAAVEEEEAYAQDEDMDDELWAALHDEEFEDTLEELDDGFVLQANAPRETELVAAPARPRRGQPVEAPISEEGEGEEGAGDGMGEGGLDWEGQEAAEAAAAAGRHDGGGSSEVRLLDRQFERLMGDYEDDDIGELEQDDPDVRGAAPIEAYDELMDDYLREQATRSSVRSFDDYRQGWAPVAREGAGGCSSAEAAAEPVASPERAEGSAARTGEEQEGGEEEEEGVDDGDLEGHPFFDVLRAPRKEDEWDAETILSTYSTADNHSKRISVPRPPKAEHIRIHSKTGLPVGAELPCGGRVGGHGRAEGAAAAGCEARAEEREPVNLGEARTRGEDRETKRLRKQAVREGKQAPPSHHHQLHAHAHRALFPVHPGPHLFGWRAGEAAGEEEHQAGLCLRTRGAARRDEPHPPTARHSHPRRVSAEGWPRIWHALRRITRRSRLCAYCIRRREGVFARQ